MAWNPKALKGMNRKPKRELDRFDLEAEAEGNAIRGAAALRPNRAAGKGTLKDRNREGRGERIHQTKIEKRYVA